MLIQLISKLLHLIDIYMISNVIKKHFGLFEIINEINEIKTSELKILGANRSILK